MPNVLQVALGGALGAALRYLVVVQMGRWMGPAFPWGTLTVNVAGSFAMGVLAAALGPRAGMTPLLMTGVLGGFTTYSAFSLDTLALVERAAPLQALGYVAATLAGAIGGCAAGLVLGRAVWP
ncbi:fluoride efflux transporter CrcB [Rhodobacteraceae bacterium 2CG4]|uniref:Fluoride-specific ion channel FluC n=1 Tax=Halovulum marinum TaxID=2662447 RepID=A0A6L5Z5N1_9RHOB|nr:CrcB family protein [Halovulum marinum]MSU91619.1 fluoride efflux transporter CrcB [Halovulum marinum]